LDAIEVKQLVKHYGETHAVNDVSFSVPRGEVFGFLGPNGAGKTTTIKILTTLIRPSRGQATLLGYDVVNEPRKIRSRIGVVQQQDSYDMALSVETSLSLYGLLWNVPKGARKRRREEIIARFDLESVRKTKCEELSIGLRRRLQVGREFMHDMDLLFLDEPTVGLDPIARRAALDFFKERVKGGLTIFFTTHIMEEAEYLCDRIAIINHGKIVKVDSPANIKRNFRPTKAIEITLEQPVPKELLDRLQSVGKIERVMPEGQEGHLKILTPSPAEVIPELIRLVEARDLRVASIYVAEPSLEEAFIGLLTEDKAS
jgi:ABC-2 type transport system ATP-binding protein